MWLNGGCMRVLLSLAFLLSLGSPRAEAFLQQQGEEVAARLTARFDDVRADCGSPSRPAFLCSGVIIRATEYSGNFDFWNPSPGSKYRGGVSFSYLRSGSVFVKGMPGLVKDFIAMPPMAGAVVSPFKYVCVFPVDAATDLRSDRGCGMVNGDLSSRYCSSQGIVSAEQYVGKYYADMWSGFNPKHKQCSFDVREGSPNSANSFYQNLKAIAGVNYLDPHCDENEMVAMTWSDNIPSQLPIEALFYFNRSGRDNSLAVSYAQYDQRRFKAETGKFLPIISLRLPNHYSGRATFMYFTSDQAITE
ncbi:N-acyl homoserine lactonase [Pseudomonas xantholysinigenes]|uniref:Halovibrin HvnA n=1 Tax=Pseudomonas xantholysinigenes TaxID=2745490 RepID=A0A9E6PX21_9PSED|nr:N-acyl homoserine lactonase [Pseudomonas xantholysinigenes]QXI39090.1 halovibrin HvnA [Pseudomonas xantholysinigenes]